MSVSPRAPGHARNPAAAPENEAHPLHWSVELVRAVVALLLAMVVTFNSDHSPAMGFASFAAFALATGLIHLAASALHRGDRQAVAAFVAQGAVGIAAGITSFALGGATLPAFLWLVGGWALLSGGLELWFGVRSMGRSEAARDRVFAGGITLLFAVVMLALPPGYSQPFRGPDGVSGELTASVIAVGALGAYAAVLGVYLLIGALSLRWRASDATAQKEASES